MSGPQEQLRQLQAEGLLRALKPLDSPAGPRVSRNGRELWNFASNDYLGLARHPEIENALIEGVRRYGAGSAASRLVCGSLPPHVLLEESLAEAKQSEAALVFSSGFATALGTITAVVGPEDVVVLDKLCHASLVDASRLSGATIRVFPHNQVEKLRQLLARIRGKSPHARILVVTESVFSMDGDLAPLKEICDAVETWNALLLVDEAHGFGVLGQHGMGLAELEGQQSRITFQMGTLSKAAGLSGGYLAASRDWIDLLVNRARSFIYSTAPLPSLAHAALVSLNLIRSAEGERLRDELRQRVALLPGDASTPIFPKVFGANESALAAASALEQAGFLVPAIRFPTVPRGGARLRVSLSAAHPLETVEALSRRLGNLHAATGPND